MCRPEMRHFWTNDKKPYLCKRLTGTEVEDSTLIARVKAGDRGAFNELYGIYWASLVNYAGLFVGDDGAEDVVQDVFVRVWLRRDNLRDDGTLQGYLLRSVYHASLNALKKGANATAYRSWVTQQIEQKLLRPLRSRRQRGDPQTLLAGDRRANRRGGRVVVAQVPRSVPHEPYRRTFEP